METLERIRDAIFRRKENAGDAGYGAELPSTILHLACVVDCLKTLIHSDNWRVTLLHVPTRTSLDVDLQSRDPLDATDHYWVEDVHFTCYEARKNQLVAYVPYGRIMGGFGEEHVLLLVISKGLVQYLGTTLGWDPVCVPGKLLRLVQTSTCHWKLSEDTRLEILRSSLTALRIYIMVQERKIRHTCGQCGTVMHCSWCSGCKKVAYCSSSCQLQHYPIHKKICSNTCVTGSFDVYAYKSMCEEVASPWIDASTPMACVYPKDAKHTLYVVTPSGSAIPCAEPRASTASTASTALHKHLIRTLSFSFDVPYKLQIPNNLTSKFLDLQELTSQSFHFACTSTWASGLREAKPLYEALVQQNPHVDIATYVVSICINGNGELLLTLAHKHKQIDPRKMIAWACRFTNITVAQSTDCFAIHHVYVDFHGDFHHDNLKLTMDTQQWSAMASNIHHRLRLALLEGKKGAELQKQSVPVTCSLCGIKALPQFCPKCTWSLPICSTACYKSNYKKHLDICSSKQPFLIMLPLD